MKNKLNKRIENLRSLMIETAQQKGNLTHPEVLEISRRLDNLINEIQRERFNQYRGYVTFRPHWSSFFDRGKLPVVRFFRQYVETQS